MSVTIAPNAAPSADDAEIPDVPIYRLSVAQYEAMAKAGILTEDDPVELLEGWLVGKMTKHPPHIAASRLLLHSLGSLLPKGWMVDAQNPVATMDSEPEPDLIVIRGTPRNYTDRLAGPQDTALVVEVADTSLRQDRGTKKRLYARAGFPIYWIVNLIERQIEVYSEPSGPRRRPDYRRRQDYRPSEEIPVVLEGVEVGRIPVRELLP
jgi:Uma2 family endonuclease